MERENLKEVGEELRSIFCKIEETVVQMKDGKFIPAYDKILGVRQKVVNLETAIKKYLESQDSENNRNE